MAFLEAGKQYKKITSIGCLWYVFSILINLTGKEQQACIIANWKEKTPRRHTQTAEFKSI